jgi:hypothetical protein
MFINTLKPYSLSFMDIVDEIQASSIRIEQLAADRSQLEQRDMHMKLVSLERLIIGQLEP